MKRTASCGTTYSVINALLAGTALLCVGCQSKLPNPTPTVTDQPKPTTTFREYLQEKQQRKQREHPEWALLPGCRVGNVCVFRPPTEGSYAFGNLQAYMRFRQLEAAHDPEPYDRFETSEEGFAGDTVVNLIFLPKSTQIRMLKIRKDGGAEAVVIKDNYLRVQSGLERGVPVKLVGHKIWLVDAAKWTATPASK